MKSPLQITLQTLAPSICIETLWSLDEYADRMSDACDGEDPANDDDWMAWQSEVRATAVLAGDMIRGTDYLGGTYERIGDDPSISNPEISGYESGMVYTAVTELLLKAQTDTPQCLALRAEIDAILNSLS